MRNNNTNRGGKGGRDGSPRNAFRKGAASRNGAPRKRVGSDEEGTSGSRGRAFKKRPDDGIEAPRRTFSRAGAGSTAPRRNFRKDEGNTDGSTEKTFTRRTPGNSRPVRGGFKSGMSRGDDKPRRSFKKDDGNADGSTEKTFTRRASGNSRPDRGGFKSGMSRGDDKPRRSFKKDDVNADGSTEKSFTRRTPGNSRPDRGFKSGTSRGDDKPRRSFKKDDGNADGSTEKTFTRRASGNSRPDRGSYKPGTSGGDDRPRRSFKKSDESEGSAKKRYPKTVDGDSKRPAYKNTVKAKSGGKSKAPKKSEITELRLNQYIAKGGLCSRREADKMIEQGLVKVNGAVVTEMGVKVLPTDDVRVDGTRIKPEKKVYLLLNKPKDTVTTLKDPHAKHTVYDIIKHACEERLFPVGRLDRNTTGVLLFTNDGELSARLTHPKYNHKKIYHVFLNKALTKNDLQQVVDGFELEDGFIQADEANYVEPTDKTQVGIEIHSGRNRIVRRMFEHLGYDVVKLDRVYFAGLTKKNVPRGKFRFLTDKEVNILKRQQK